MIAFNQTLTYWYKFLRIGVCMSCLTTGLSPASMSDLNREVGMALPRVE